MAADRKIRDPVGDGSVDRYEAVDVLVIAEQRFHAAQIAQPLFPDRGDEQDVADGLDAGGVERAHHRQQFGEPAGVVADAGRVEPAVPFLDGQVGAFREHRVEMRRHDQPGPAAAAAPHGHSAKQIGIAESLCAI